MTTSPASLSKTVIAPFTVFIMMFIGAGFIAGSVVHFGEGVTTWDVSVLLVGVVMFVAGSYAQEVWYKQHKMQGREFAWFLFFSFVLSLGIGMASGGTQHFIDTPAYSAVLIPLGLSLGLIAYTLRDRIRLNPAQWFLVFVSCVLLSFATWKGLVAFNSILPDSLRVGHGSHGDHHGQERHPSDATQGEIDMAKMMGITVKELRKQTPEEHMKMMQEMMTKGHGGHGNHDAHDHQQHMHGWLAAQGIDISTLPEAKESEVLQVADGDRIELHPTLVRKKILDQEFAMYGYNGQIPGPIIKAKQNAIITVDVINNIDMETTIHWHGIRLDNANDGVPDVTQEVIQPDGSFTYTVQLPDEGIYWYHPHVREDIQQDLGLYGNLLVSPTQSDAYAPVNQEEVIVLDDLMLTDDKTLTPYGEDDATHPLMGRFGNVVITNGKTVEDLYARQGSVVRFYVTNVANTRTFKFSFSGPTPQGTPPQMKLVGSDVGRYEREQWVDDVTIAPAERYIVDVYFPVAGTYELNHKSPLAELNLAHVHVLEEDNPEENWLSKETSRESFVDAFNTLRSHPDVIADIDNFRQYFDQPVDKTLELSIELAGGMDHSMMMEEHTDDGIEWEDTMAQMNAMMTGDQVHWKLIDVDTGAENMDIQWQFTVGDVKKVRIVNTEDSAHPMQHPIHFHGQRFLVLSMDGKPNENLVWKDTVLVPTGSTVDLLFDMSNPGEWMFHCHIAEHLTNGMMGMFTVAE